MLKFVLLSFLAISLIGCSSTPEHAYKPIARQDCRITTMSTVDNDLLVASLTRSDCTHYELSKQAQDLLARQCDVKYRTVIHQNKSGEEMIFNCADANGGFKTGSYIKLY